ncbi:MAG TPA: hypothetical protein VMX54_14995 [Vicinamibacteria bacterium]|nr:hypothetical protein [Vicinamibacteria bacterium]
MVVSVVTVVVFAAFLGARVGVLVWLAALWFGGGVGLVWQLRRGGVSSPSTKQLSTLARTYQRGGAFRDPTP